MVIGFAGIERDGDFLREFGILRQFAAVIGFHPQVEKIIVMFDGIFVAITAIHPQNTTRFARFLAKCAKTARNIISRKIERVEKGITAIPAQPVMAFSVASTEGTRQ